MQSAQVEAVLCCVLGNHVNHSVLTLRLDGDFKSRLEKLAQSTRRSESFLAAKAIREYISANEWQITEIKKAVKEADRGDFASAHEVRRVLSQRTKHSLR